MKNDCIRHLDLSLFGGAKPSGSMLSKHDHLLLVDDGLASERRAPEASIFYIRQRRKISKQQRQLKHQR